MPNDMLATTSESVRTHVMLHKKQMLEHFPAFYAMMCQKTYQIWWQNKWQNIVSTHMSGRVCQDSLSIHVPCLLPNRLSGWGSLDAKQFIICPCWRSSWSSVSSFTVRGHVQWYKKHVTRCFSHDLQTWDVLWQQVLVAQPAPKGQAMRQHLLRCRPEDIDPSISLQFLAHRRPPSR